MAVKVNCYFVVSYDNFLNFDLYSNWSAFLVGNQVDYYHSEEMLLAAK